jgi:hypothetical protein
MILLGNWNEWGEGQYLAPHAKYGFGYVAANIWTKAAEPEYWTEAGNWTHISDADACGIMNGNDRELQTALLSLLQARMIHKIEFLAAADGADALQVVPDLPAGK